MQFLSMQNHTRNNLIEIEIGTLYTPLNAENKTQTMELFTMYENLYEMIWFKEFK